MEWYEAIRQMRHEKNEMEPGTFSGAACARRAGVAQSTWSRMELGLPKGKEGDAPKATVTLLRMASRGLCEPYEVICNLAGFTSDLDDIPMKRLATRLKPLFAEVPKERREAVEEALIQVAKVLTLNAA